jgi:DNA-binding LacI/PurR family transcriptional regulator
MSSLRDVARHAGVSLATASRVASGSVAVRPQTRARVERAMRELLYVPPKRQPSVGAIGLLVPELLNPIFPALAQEMERRATSLDLATILCNTAGSALREADYVHMLVERRVDGMIFISAEATDLRSDHAHYERMLEENARFVFVNGGADSLGVPAVGVDERAAGLLAAQHLVDLGHRRIGFVAGPTWSLPTQEKHAGIEAALLTVEGAEFAEANGEYGVAGGRSAMSELLDRGEHRPTGVVCASDLMAIGALHESLARGLRVPHDVSIVGFDGIEAARWTQPALTTIEQPIVEIAETAVDALVSQIDDPQRDQPSYVFRPRLRRGATPAPPI